MVGVIDGFRIQDFSVSRLRPAAAGLRPRQAAFLFTFSGFLNPSPLTAQLSIASRLNTSTPQPLTCPPEPWQKWNVLTALCVQRCLNCSPARVAARLGEFPGYRARLPPP